MPNRSEMKLPELPVIYEYVKANYPAYPPIKKVPGELQIFDVTFLHFHNLIEIALCVEGEGICYVDGEAYPFRTGDVQIVFPFQRHLSKSTGDHPSRWHWLNVDGAELMTRVGFADVAAVDRKISQEMGLCGIIDREKYPGICKLATDMVREVFAPDENRIYRMEYLGACFYMLLMELCQASRELPKIAARQDSTLKEIAPALLEIRNAVNAGHLPEVGKLSELCGMSPASLRRKFKTAVGVAARDYIAACCIHRACRLLSCTDWKIIEISDQCGFQDISGFNRCFLKYVGMTPREYRRGLICSCEPDICTVKTHKN